MGHKDREGSVVDGKRIYDAQSHRPIGRFGVGVLLGAATRTSLHSMIAATWGSPCWRGFQSGPASNCRRLLTAGAIRGNLLVDQLLMVSEMIWSTPVLTFGCFEGLDIVGMDGKEFRKCLYTFIHVGVELGEWLEILPNKGKLLRGFLPRRRLATTNFTSVDAIRTCGKPEPCSQMLVTW